MQRENEAYRDFTEEDFLTDPLFQDWVLAPTRAKDAFWQNLQIQYPAKTTAIKNAKLLLTQINFTEDLPPDALVNEKYLEYKQRIAFLESEEIVSKKTEAGDPPNTRIIRWPPDQTGCPSTASPAPQRT